MKERALYSIEEARKLLGGISRNTIYGLLRTGALPSVLLGCRRFISSEAIQEFVRASTTRVSPSDAALRVRALGNRFAQLPAPESASRSAAERGHLAILPSLSKR